MELLDDDRARDGPEPVAPGPSPATTPPVSGLPTERTSFVGRRRELRELAELLRTSRLVTVLGAAGAGKSRLAQRVAVHTTVPPRDGVRYVGLGAVERPDRLTRVVADQIGLQSAGDADVTRLLGWFASRELLLVLDDGEHLAVACADLVDRILTCAPKVRILVASREPLGVAGEVLYALTPLPVPRAGLRPTAEDASRWDAVQLLLERAAAVCHGYTLEEDQVAAVVAICRRLDGLPLALELAAARFSHLTAEEIAERLDDRFRLLTSNVRAGGGRHRTLEEAIDWSYDLLDPDEQAVLRRVAIFANGATVAGAEAVCGDELAGRVLDALASMTERSLLVAERSDGTTRYRLLETIRQYARERLQEQGETDDTSARHARWYLDTIAAVAGIAEGDRSSLATVTAAYDDIGAAITWASGAGEADLALGLAASLWRACEVTGRLSDGRDLLTAALRVEGWTDAALRDRVLDGAASLALLQGDLEEAHRLHAAARELCRRNGDRAGEATAIRSLGLVALLRRDLATAEAHAEEALSTFRDLGDERGIGFCLASWALVQRARGDTGAARAAFSESLQRLTDLGLTRHAADVLSNLGDLAHDAKDLAEARACYRAAGQRYAEADDVRGAALALNNLALVVRQEGDVDLAVQVCGDAVQRFEAIGDRPGAAAALNNLANLNLEQGRPDQARSHYEASLAIYTELGDRSGTGLVRQHLAELDQPDHRRTPAEPSGIPLTPREREVVDLVAEGLDNRDIAERLSISERTVESHIGHVRQKVQVTSRTRLVRWVLDHRTGG